MCFNTKIYFFFSESKNFSFIIIVSISLKLFQKKKKNQRLQVCQYKWSKVIYNYLEQCGYVKNKTTKKNIKTNEEDACIAMNYLLRQIYTIDTLSRHTGSRFYERI